MLHRTRADVASPSTKELQVISTNAFSVLGGFITALCFSHAQHKQHGPAQPPAGLIVLTPERWDKITQKGTDAFSPNLGGISLGGASPRDELADRRGHLGGHGTVRGHNGSRCWSPSQGSLLIELTLIDRLVD